MRSFLKTMSSCRELCYTSKTLQLLSIHVSGRHFSISLKSQEKRFASLEQISLNGRLPRSGSSLTPNYGTWWQNTKEWVRETMNTPSIILFHSWRKMLKIFNLMMWTPTIKWSLGELSLGYTTPSVYVRETLLAESLSSDVPLNWEKKPFRRRQLVKHA